MTEFRAFTTEDWMGYGGAAGAPMIATPDLNNYISAHVKGVDIVVDAQGVCVVIADLEYEIIPVMWSKGAKDIDAIGDNEPPTREQMEMATKALNAVTFAKNHVELVGALALQGFEVL